MEQERKLESNGKESEEGSRASGSVYHQEEEAKGSSRREDAMAAVNPMEGGRNFLRINLTNTAPEEGNPPTHRDDDFVLGTSTVLEGSSNTLRISRHADNDAKEVEEGKADETREEGERGPRADGRINGNCSPYTSVSSLLSGSDYPTSGAPQ
ncbi:hypothetical protein GUITHDRAFT_149849 [Guillardia theta CCMP2712]|uniref:Uncharacterized protein n=2 Tax=Guillardia theta TaxID=55529 RepID=L1K2E9_GUITC|nr:hypothetical protein GUITHDRAFT_149849 [Guillardia theta CCMP2712]EKX54752.1 hypothetical protein GUITHDRAFT_149849 [Guillardia theta CCMP2712]|eukprot:XP_005841732.1 hypothetical protein GUITHDRAFT_149849 [Guillardia theta CCMP2712]